MKQEIDWVWVVVTSPKGWIYPSDAETLGLSMFCDCKMAAATFMNCTEAEAFILMIRKRDTLDHSLIVRVDSDASFKKQVRDYYKQFEA